MRVIVILILLLTSTLKIFASGGNGGKINLHVVTLGINTYSGMTFSNAVNDAKAISKKFGDDSKQTYARSVFAGKKLNSQQIKYYRQKERETKIVFDSIYNYNLYEEKATLSNIRKLLKNVVKNSSSNDFLVFYYAGGSVKISEAEVGLIPFGAQYNADFEYDRNELLTISEISSYLNQISANNQMVIFDSCYGISLSPKLIANLFEDNPIIAEQSKRNRLIIAPNDLGMDSSDCDPDHGPLAYYMLQSKNLMQGFFNSGYLEFELNGFEIACPVKNTKYFSIYNELEFREVLLTNFLKTANSRGAKPFPKGKQNKEITSSKNYALIIATSRYDQPDGSWKDLKNPINDAEKIASLLENKFNTVVKKIYDKTRNEFLQELIAFKRQLNEGDKLIFFIAGHGYYSDILSDGFIVFKDSSPIESDPYLNSYLSMGTLNKILDGSSSKQILAIFDVCYGANFEINNADLVLDNYQNASFDKGLDNFVEEKNQKTSRIVLASGKYEVPDFWSNSLDHSPFAQKLITALEQEEDFISPGKFLSYLQGNATLPSLKKFGKHEATGDFLLKVD